MFSAIVSSLLMFTQSGAAAPAEPPAPLPVDPAESSELAAPKAPLPRCAAGVVPALTPVKLATLEPLGTKLNKSGDFFKMVLIEPVVLGDCEAIPAGANVTAEVIQSKKSQFWGGTGGEFIAAARFMEVGERKLRMRSLTMRMRGADKIIWAASTPGGGAITFGYVESGKKSVGIEKGTVFDAKTAEPFDLTAPD